MGPYTEQGWRFTPSHGSSGESTYQEQLVVPEQSLEFHRMLFGEAVANGMVAYSPPPSWENT